MLNAFSKVLMAVPLTLSFNSIGMAQQIIPVNLVPEGSNIAQTQNPCPPGKTCYNAVKDFSIISNPNAVWSYGWTASLGAALNLYTVTDTTSIPGMSAWLRSGTYSANPPYVAHNDTTAPICHQNFCVPPTFLHLHPGAAGEYSVVRWTAPTAGIFQIRGAFEGLDSAPTTTDVHVRVNSKGFLNGPITSYFYPLAFRLTIDVEVGDTVDFAVGIGRDASYDSDSTGIQVVIAP